MINTFRWDQSRTGGDDGQATFFLDGDQELTVHMYTFKEAFELEQCIRRTMHAVRVEARAELLTEITTKIKA